MATISGSEERGSMALTPKDEAYLQGFADAATIAIETAKEWVDSVSKIDRKLFYSDLLMIVEHMRTLREGSPAAASDCLLPFITVPRLHHGDDQRG